MRSSICLTAWLRTKRSWPAASGLVASPVVMAQLVDRGQRDDPVAIQVDFRAEPHKPEPSGEADPRGLRWEYFKSSARRGTVLKTALKPDSATLIIGAGDSRIRIAVDDPVTASSEFVMDTLSPLYQPCASE